MNTLLELRNVSIHYGGVKALTSADIEINAGEVVALMGPNGAGKSTALKAMFGLVPLDEGSVVWHEHTIIARPWEMVARGISFVPQGRRVFSHMSVEENLEVSGLVVANKQEVQDRKQELMKLFPVLHQKRKAKAGTLSGGQQQMVALARGLMTDPKVLLLDEPSLGLAPKVVRQVFEKIKEINQVRQTAIVIVEHNLKSLLEIVDRGYVLDKGLVVARDSGERLIKSDILEKVFLGKAA